MVPGDSALEAVNIQKSENAFLLQPGQTASPPGESGFEEGQMMLRANMACPRCTRRGAGERRSLVPAMISLHVFRGTLEKHSDNGKFAP